MNIETITSLGKYFNCLIGLSDHSMGYTEIHSSKAKGFKVIGKAM